VSHESKPSKNSKQSLKSQKSKRGLKQGGPRIGIKRALTYENSESDGPQLGSINGDQSGPHEESKDDVLMMQAHEHPLTPIPLIVKKQKLSDKDERIVIADGSNSEKGFNDHSIKILNIKAAKRPENAAMDNDHSEMSMRHDEELASISCGQQPSPRSLHTEMIKGVKTSKQRSKD